MRRYAILSVPIVLTACLAVALNVFHPLDSGPAGILAVFALIYLFFLSIFSLFIYFASQVISRQRGKGEGNVVHPRKAYYLASVIACLPVFLLAMRSIGELSAIDILLASFFVFLASFYIARRT